MRILIVDDDAASRGSCERTLRNAGHDVEALATGEEAAPRLGEAWDIILAEISMPGGVSGFELVRRARGASLADILVLASFAEREFAVQALRLGAYDFILKPFGPEVLSAAIRRCVGKRRLSMELEREAALRAGLERALEAGGRKDGG